MSIYCIVDKIDEIYIVNMIHFPNTINSSPASVINQVCLYNKQATSIYSINIV